MSKETPGAVEFRISVWTILKIVLVFLALWLAYILRDIVAITLVALVFAAAIGPSVDWFEKKRIPRPVGAIIIYIVSLSFLALIIGLLVPPLINQIKELAGNFSYLWEKISLSFVNLRDYGGEASVFPQTVEKGLATLESFLSSAIRGAFSTVTSIFGGVFSFIVILVMTFYLVIQEDALKKTFYHFFPVKHAIFAADICVKIQRKIVLWLRGQLFLCFVVGLAAYIGLLILGVKYALILGIFAGLFEIVPYAGPFLGGAVAVLFALAQSPFKAFLVAILFVVIQQLENNFLVPKVMQKAVGLHPIISILALMIGIELGGIVGGLFAIPAATALDIIIRALIQRQQGVGEAVEKGESGGV